VTDYIQQRYEQYFVDGEITNAVFFEHFYADVFELRDVLDEDGFDDWASQIDVACAGCTSGEILPELRWVLSGVAAQESLQESAAQQAQLLVNIITQVLDDREVLEKPRIEHKPCSCLSCRHQTNFLRRAAMLGFQKRNPQFDFANATVEAKELCHYLQGFAQEDMLVSVSGARYAWDKDQPPVDFFPGGDTWVFGITYDSRQVQPGWLFVCKGSHFNNQYLHDALELGATGFVYETGFIDDQTLEWARENSQALAIEVSNLRAALPLIANYFHDYAWKKITTIGITGTKGKSTTAYYVKSILDSWAASQGHPPTAILSSIDTFDGVQHFESHLTTPEIFELHQHFANAANSGIQHLVMEVSSQGLKYERVGGVTFDVGCFLNIGEDHISPIEHPDVEDYLNSKLLLFKQARTAVVNVGMGSAEQVWEAATSCLDSRHTVSFAVASTDLSSPQEDKYLRSDLQATQIEAVAADGVDGLLFHVEANPDGYFADVETTSEFTLGMTGMFNVDNALAAITIARMLGVPEAHIHTGLGRVSVPGRMEIFHLGSGSVAIIDYAHNSMSFEQLFSSVDTMYPGTRRTIVFGCPGQKALGRRRELGTLAGSFCDRTYLTEEDPGEEPVEQICEEIATYVSEGNGEYRIICDRQEAISAALTDARSDPSRQTVVMITGKGRETRQKRGKDYVSVTSDFDLVEGFVRA